MASIAAAPAAAALPQSWNGYKWSRTGNLTIRVGNNLDSNWSPYLAPATTGWSADPLIDMLPVAGASTSACAAVYGSVQVCNGNYGKNGWLGYANVWTSGSRIVMGTVRLNDYYFSQAKYNTTAWRQMTICQEIGHTLGLAHADVGRSNANLGTCMDYTNDPSGTTGSNGTLANVTPSDTDFAALAGIYATPDATQLVYTLPDHRTGDGYSVDGFDTDTYVAVPEPSAWALLLTGFGITGAMLRRRRPAHGQIAA